MSLKKKVARGFTLIELVIVIAVIAILAALLVPTIIGQAERARVSRAAGEVAEIGKALARIRTETGVSATTCLNLGNLACTTSAAAFVAASGATPCVANCGALLPACNGAAPGAVCWGGPYMAAPVANDPWGTAYAVSPVGTSGALQVKCLGANLADNACAAGTDDICKTF